MTSEPQPFQSLQAGSWFKLICGASYQALPEVRNLTLAYALAGVDCVDVAADPAVIAAAQEGLAAAQAIAQAQSRPYYRPWLMVSMSAGEDPHFRKAWFDPARCPADCPRPCEKICPAAAIDTSGVIRDRCYGCGRCEPVCPLGLIETRSHPTALNDLAHQALRQADALEIHTHVGQTDAFQSLWQTLQSQTSHLKLISISCPDEEGLIDYLQTIQHCLFTVEQRPSTPPIVMWQTDGRPMSGDIGKGTTHAAIRLAQKVLAANLKGYVQLAGGTNQHTVPKLKALNLLKNHPKTKNPAGSPEARQVELQHSDKKCPKNATVGEISNNLNLNTKPLCSGDRGVSGIAYGSFARHLLMPVLGQTLYLEEVPATLWEAVALAESLVKPLKESAISLPC
jgi:Fe-S-cluster-containing hydrogenase component 2